MKHNRLTVLSPFPLFDQWYFTSLRRSRNENFTEIRAGSLSRNPWRIASLLNSLFATRSCALKCEPARRLVVYKKIRKYRRNLFFAKLGVLNWRHNRSQSPVFGLAVLYSTGSEIWRFWYIKTRGRKIAINKKLLYLSVQWGDLIEQIKKKSVIYTLRKFVD